MHPTIDEQLRGALRLLELLGTTIPVPEDTHEVLVNVTRLLRHAQRAAVSVPAFHRRDNAELTVLLVELGEHVTEDAAAGWDGGDAGHDDDATAARRNVQLRSRLCRVIERLPLDASNDSARAVVGAYLLRRVDQDPV